MGWAYLQGACCCCDEAKGDVDPCDRGKLQQCQTYQLQPQQQASDLPKRNDS